MLSREQFEQLVLEGVARLPAQFRERIANVAVLVEEEPSEEDRHEQGLAPEETLLGLYKGVPHTERGSLYGVEPTLPDTITIYQLPIEEAAGDDPERIRQIVADTVWHEFGHHFGLEEDEVRARERERGVEEI